MSGKSIRSVKGTTWQPTRPHNFCHLRLKLTSPSGASQSFLSCLVPLSEILFYWQCHVLPRNWYPLRPKISEHLKIPRLFPVVCSFESRHLSAKEHTSRRSLFLLFSFGIDVHPVNEHLKCFAIVEMRYTAFPFILREASYFLYITSSWSKIEIPVLNPWLLLRLVTCCLDLRFDLAFASYLWCLPKYYIFIEYCCFR